MREMKKPITPLAYSVGDTAAMLSIRPPTVWALIRNGRLNPVRLGRRTIIPASEIERLLSEPSPPARPGVQRKAK